MKIYSSKTKFLNLLFFILVGISLHSCSKVVSKDDDSNSGSGSPNWEIIRNFDEKKSYTSVEFTVHNNKLFFSTYGHNGITPGSEGSLHDLLGSYFYLYNDQWMLYQTTNFAIVQMKVFNNKLYGIREYREPYYAGALKTYRHKYIFYKWEHDNFTDLDSISVINNEQIELHKPEFWVHNNKLHLITTLNSTTLKLFDLSNEKLELLSLEFSMSATNRNLVDGGLVSYTLTNTYPVTETLFETEVLGYWFNGSNLQKGNKYLFQEYLDMPERSNNYQYYITIKGTLYGFKGNEIFNIDDNKKVVASMPTDQQFNTSTGYFVSKRGKVLNIGMDKQGNAKNLYLFDGNKLEKFDYRLPEILDPNSKVMDFIEIDNTIYLVLMNRFQYVIVKSI